MLKLTEREKSIIINMIDTYKKAKPFRNCTHSWSIRTTMYICIKQNPCDNISYEREYEIFYNKLKGLLPPPIWNKEGEQEPEEIGLFNFPNDAERINFLNNLLLEQS